MIQFFHWYYPEDGSLWNHFRSDCEFLANLGVTDVWLPPAMKGASGTRSVGYDPYDLFDLGEFDQKGTTRTKYGTKVEYEESIDEANRFGMKILADVVMNHRAGADFAESILVTKMKEGNRNHSLGENREVKGLTGFSFSNRGSKYSDFVWDKTCFKAVDWDQDTGEKAIFLFIKPYGTWEEVIGTEKGNYDYLMFADLDFRNERVRAELNKWGVWLLSEIKVNGFRIDAAKHINPSFLLDWISRLDKKLGTKAFAVAEFWSGDLKLLRKFLKATSNRFSLFDVPLHYNLYKASIERSAYDLRYIFKETLVSRIPHKAVTFVDNHDTQPYQALESWVEPWFKPLAYALILLRKEGVPCIFYTDLYSAAYKETTKRKKIVAVELEKVKELEMLMMCRKLYAYGRQTDYFDSPECIGWVRVGEIKEHSFAMVVIMNNGNLSFKEMKVGEKYIGRCFSDVLKNSTDLIMIDEHGVGKFVSSPCSVSVYLLHR